MFHGKPINQSQQFPLTPQEHNNLRASQSGQKQIQVKFYLPDDEIRRTTILSDCNLQRITEQIKSYASVADKDLLLAWNDDQNEWIRFDSESEFYDAMNYARHLLSLNSVFKIQVKEGKTPTIKKQPEQQQQQPKPVVNQPPVQQPVTKPPVQQQPITQPNPFHPPQFPSQPYSQPFRPPVQPMMNQPPMMAMNQPPMSQPMMAMNQQMNQPQMNQPQMNQPQMNQPQMNQPQGNNMPIPRGGSSPYTTPNRTLTNSVTMQQSHPLNSFGSSPSSTAQSPVQPTIQPNVQPTVQQSPVQHPNINQDSLNTLRGFGFGCDDAVLIKALMDANGDINVATDKLLLNQ